jgi:membrane-bound lytic murein transglycosylase
MNYQLLSYLQQCAKLPVLRSIFMKMMQIPAKTRELFEKEFRQALDHLEQQNPAAANELRKQRHLCLFWFDQGRNSVLAQAFAEEVAKMEKENAKPNGYKPHQWMRNIDED